MASTSIPNPATGAPPGPSAAPPGEEGHKTAPAPEIDSICSFGDIVLVADDGNSTAVKLRVSSCILGMASKVFQALFSEKFKEGQKDGQNSDQPREVLVEDDPHGMQVLCRLLHHLPAKRDARQNITVDQALDFAITADKYDCIEAVRLSVIGLLDPLLFDARDVGDAAVPGLSKLAAVAYIMDQPDIFRSVTALLVLDARSVRLKNFPQQSHDFLPNRLIMSLASQQMAARGELAHHIGVLVNAYTEEMLGKDQPILVSRLLINLRNKGVFPMSHNSASIQKLLNDLAELVIPSTEDIQEPKPETCDCAYQNMVRPHAQLYATGWKWTSLRREAPYFHSPECCAQNDEEQTRWAVHVEKEHVYDIVTNIEDICAGVCLDCIKRETGSERRPCRSPHPKPWTKRQRGSAADRNWLDIDSFVDGDVAKANDSLDVIAGDADTEDASNIPGWFEDEW